VILDEAHQLAETAAQFLVRRCHRAAARPGRDTKRLAAVKAGDFPALRRAAEDLSKGHARLRPGLPQNRSNRPWAELTRYAQMAGCAENAVGGAGRNGEAAGTQAERDADLKNCYERAQAVQATLASWQRTDDPKIRACAGSKPR